MYTPERTSIPEQTPIYGTGIWRSQHGPNNESSKSPLPCCRVLFGKSYRYYSVLFQIRCVFRDGMGAMHSGVPRLTRDSH
jgi:hypothetical protein